MPKSVKKILIVEDEKPMARDVVKYTPDGGSLKLSISKANGQLSIVVADTGYGISKNQAVKFRLNPKKTKAQHFILRYL